MMKKTSIYNRLPTTIIFLSLLFFLVLPIVYTLTSALFSENSFSNQLLLLDSKTFLLLGESSILALIIASFSTIIGTILGFLLYKTNIPFRHFFKIAFLIPLFISPYILAVAWKDFFYLFFQNSQIISSYFGVIWVLVSVFTPLSMLIMGSALANINASLEESGLVVSNSKIVIFKILLPLIKPALSTSFILVFIFSISEFSVPAFFGIKVFTTEIFTQFSAFYNHSLAILQSALLIIICILLLLSENKYIANAPFLSIAGKGTKTHIYKLNNKQNTSLAFLFFWFFTSIILPFFILSFQSFKDGGSSFLKAFELLLPTVGSSFILAFIAAFLILLIGFIAAYQSEIHQKKSITWVLLFAFAIPSIIFGISFIKFYNQPWLNFIYSSYAIIIIAYVGKFSFIASKIIGNAIKQIPKSLDEAAQIQGISFSKRIRKILVPLLIPALFAAFMLSFVFSLGELACTIMLYPPGTELMPIKVFTIMANAPQALTSSMTLIVFSLTLLVIMALYFIMKSFFKNPAHVNH